MAAFIAGHLETFLEEQRCRDRRVPRFVERELRSFLECGILARGFLRVHCDVCRQDRLVPFSCKCRGSCPSCGGRRMADTAAHLVDRVFPEVPVRQWVLSLPFALRYRLAYDKPLCASLDGFTLHAATRAGGFDAEGREALLLYVLRPPIAQGRVEQQPDGLVRITLKKAYADGTVAVDMDPLSLLCRLATSVPPARFHTIHCAGVLAAASPWRSCITPPLPPTAETVEPEKRVRKSGYRPWAELLERTFALDVLTCPSCQGRMKLLAVVKNPASIARYLAAAGELTEVPSRAPGRGPPYWKSRVLRRRALSNGGSDHGEGDGGA